MVDPDAGRPSRLLSWNISLQRELARDLVVEAAYVANRGAWFRADGLNQFNGITNERLSSFGLNLNNPADVALLPQPITAAAVVARGFTKPYAAFPNNATLAQSLRPYPQFGDVTSLWAPLGNSWYDSLQVKATKRYSYGLDFTAAYTFSKTLATVEAHDGTIVPLNDVYNRANAKSLSSSDQPHVFVTGFNYQTPGFGSNRVVKAIASGWTIGGISGTRAVLRFVFRKRKARSTLLCSVGNERQSRCRSAFVLEGPELPLLRSQQGIRPQPGSVVESRARPMGHRRDLLQ
jgi:hypothetical protein